ncbi:MAG: NAD-dependent epimerase/dehydratase family protein [Nitriliruptorales bacterium]|nr:NAD-dependent epimerase/dehydratase family protein [Nitriliruptorales bacterium]
MRVAVTGAAGFVGRRLVGELAAAGHEVVALDIAEQAPQDRVEFRRVDILEGSLAVELEGVDAVVHLAFQMDPIQDEARMARINIDGTRNVFECAEEAGVRHVVYLSSAVAYGAHADNDFPLTEKSPLRGNDDFGYARMKREVEEWLWPWAEQSSLEVAVLRPSIILGPGVRNFITKFFEMPRFVSVAGHRPPWQFTHVEDVAAAIQHVLDKELAGAFNVAPEGWLSAEEVEAIIGRRSVRVPEEVALALADRMWRAGVGHADAGIVHYIMHPWVVAVDRLVETGFRFQHSNRDVLAGFVAESRPYVTMGNVRAKRSTVAGIGVLGTAAIAGLAVAGAKVRSRRRADG